MDYITFCEKFEDIKAAVAVDETNNILCPDVHKVHDAMLKMQEYIRTVTRFRPMDYVRWSEQHDMDEVNATITAASIFLIQLEERMIELTNIAKRNISSKTQS